MVLSVALTDELRMALKALKSKRRIGAARLLREFQEWSGSPLPLSPSALDKFTAYEAGKRNTGATKSGQTHKPEEMAALYRFLREAYPECLAAPPPATPVNAVEALGGAMAHFPGWMAERASTYDLDFIHLHLPGNYVMYRPDYRPVVPPAAAKRACGPPPCQSRLRWLGGGHYPKHRTSRTGRWGRAMTRRTTA